MCTMSGGAYGSNLEYLLAGITLYSKSGIYFLLSSLPFLNKTRNESTHILSAFILNPMKPT